MKAIIHRSSGLAAAVGGAALAGQSRRRWLAPALAVVIVTGCSSSPGAQSPSAPASAPASVAPASATEAPSPTPEATATSPSPSPAETPEASLPTAVPTSIDPCQLVTQDEASKLAGASFGSGKESKGDNNANFCTYGAGATIFQVSVIVAPDTATAAAAKGQFKDELSKFQGGEFNIKSTSLPDFASGVEAGVTTGSTSSGGISAKLIAIYFEKGLVFVGLSDVSVGGGVPSSDAMQAQAKVSLGRLP